MYSIKGLGRKKPALLTSTSTRPKASIAVAKALRAAAGSATSPATPTKLAGLPRLAAASCRRSAERAVPTTL
ncbi:hypothetical protein D3C80_1977580 [compost metagenome]